MKLAGTNRGAKLSAANYALMTARPAETQEANRQALAVIDAPEFDESDAAFFAPDKGGVSNLEDSEVLFLDSMIERRGLADVLKTVEHLLESRVEDGITQGGSLILHLSRHSAWARAAERLRDLAFHPDIATL